MYSLDDITHVIVDHLGSEGAKPVLDTLKTVMLEVDKVPPVMNEGKTWGDWALSIPYVHEEIRPFTTLSYQIIDTMLRTGIIRFAVDLKRAKMVSGFRNERSLQVHCSDKVLADAALASLSKMLPQMTYEMSWSALIYGSAFMETVWGTMTGYELGISDRKTSELFSMPIQANLVPHKTIRAIKRGENGRFNGFVQNPAMHYHTHIMDQRTASLYGISYTDILVPAESALVVPYNGYSRNLWGESFLGPIYPLWFWYEIIMRCLVSYTQLMGDPPRLGKAPSKKKLQVTTTGQTIDAVDYMMAVGVNLSKSNTAVIPSDVDPETKTPQYELAYMQMPDRSQPFVNILEHLNQQILRAALSSDKTLISSPGGGAAIGEIHAEATALHDEMIVSSWLHFINKYFIKYISVYNRGTGGPPIWLELQGLDPREQALLQSVLGVAGNTKSFDDFFYSVDWRALGQLSGLPMLSEEEKDALKQKLNQEGLENQANQQILSQQLAPPEQKQLQAKLDQLTEANPVVLSQDEIDKFHPIEETRKVFVVPKPKRDPKLAAAVVATMVLEGVSDSDNPFGSIQLFNQYHDNLGRFARKVSSGASRAKEWTKKHPKEVITLGVVAATAIGVGVRDFKRSYKKTSSGTEDTVSAKTSEGRPVKSILVLPDHESNRIQTTFTGDDNTKQRLHGMAISANGIVKDLGVKTTPEIYWATNQQEWEGGYKSHNTSKAYMHRTLNSAMAYRADDGSVHVSPNYTNEVAKKEHSVAHTTGLLAHELFHSRKNLPSYSGQNIAPEEQLATVIQDTAYQRMKRGGSGRFKMSDLNKDFWENSTLGMGYPKETRWQLFRAAAYKYRNYAWAAKTTGTKKYQNISDVVDEWIRDPYPHADVNQWFKVASDLRQQRNVRHSLESVQLFNEYHDNLGRFASKGSGLFQKGKKHAKEFWEENKTEIATTAVFRGIAPSDDLDKQGSAQLFGQTGTKEVSRGKVAQIVGSVSKEYGPLVKFETVTCGDWNCVKKNTGSSSKDLLGAFSDGKLVLSPGVGNMTERVVRHETIHARQRSQGPMVLRSAEHRRVEEGCTELMTFKKVRAGTPYAKEMIMVAKAARNYAGNDTKKAWDFIQKVHYHNDTDVGVSAIRKYGSRGTENDVWWLLNNVQLETIETDERFSKSEEALYRDIRKTGNNKVESVPLPEDFE